MAKKGNRVRRILETKKQPPEHKRLDIEPKEGGRSLLHDGFGIPKVSAFSAKDLIPPVDELSNEPVQVRASVPEMPKTVSLPKKGVPISEDDGFFPPQSNFVTVGQKDHTWYAPEVTGSSPLSSDDNEEIVDNNEEVDVDSLQGMDPLIDLNKQVSEIRQQFEKAIGLIEQQSLSLIYAAQSIDELNEIRNIIFKKDGDLAAILKEFKNIPADERKVVGDLVNYSVENIKLEIASKTELLENEEEDEEDVSDTDEMFQSPSLDDMNKNVQSTAKISSLESGHFAVFIDDKLFNTASSSEDTREILSRLILGNDIDVSRIQVIKRIPIDFGIILEG